MKERLNHNEEEIMQILWRLERAFVKEIIAEMKDPKPYNTVSSIIRKLEAAGIVGYEAFGKTHRYFPILQKETYRKTSFQQFVNNYFGGSPQQLLSYFVEEENVQVDELNALLDQLKDSNK